MSVSGHSTLWTFVVRFELKAEGDKRMFTTSLRNEGYGDFYFLLLDSTSHIIRDHQPVHHHPLSSQLTLSDW